MGFAKNRKMVISVVTVALAAAALAAKMRGADAGQIKDAMGLASLFTGGLIEYQNDGTSGKIMCGGWGALTGMRASRLAACGFTGPEAALEGRYGFFQAFTGTSGHCDMSHVLDNLARSSRSPASISSAMPASAGSTLRWTRLWTSKRG